MPNQQPVSSFSKKFLWGASTSAHQVEGANHNQWSVWELENAKTKAAQAEYHISNYDSWARIKDEAMRPSNYVSGRLADHYHTYEKDFDLLQKMNMNAYRFSVEWSRIEPECGKWDKNAIEHYKNYIDNLRQRGIEPVMTLFHFTLPVWFAEMGGFEKRSNVKYFTRFSKKIVEELGLRVKRIVTINEMGIYAQKSYYFPEWPPTMHSAYKLWRVVNNLTYAHRQAAKAIHRLNRHYKVSVAHNSQYYYPGDDSWLSVASAAFWQYLTDDYMLKKVSKSCDFLGVNYYQSNRVYGLRVHNPENMVSDMDWPMTPGDIEFTIERLYRKYRLPILITENGLADAQDTNRKWWITETLIGIQNAMKNGVRVEGYIHWSLTDNFEWEFGKWPKFGLAAVNYKTGERTLRPSAVWFGKVIKKMRKI
jgi:beta-glucosidase